MSRWSRRTHGKLGRPRPALPRRGLWRWLWASLCLAAAIGCEDDFTPASRILDLRVLGTRIEVVGEPEQARPRPGETAQVDFLLTAPRPGVDPEALHSLLIRCTFPERYTGIPICQEFLDLLTSGDDLGGSATALAAERFACADEERFALAGVALSCQRGVPAVEVPVEPGFDGEAKLVRGVVCNGGTPYLDISNPALFGCEGGDGEELVHTRVPVSQGPEDDNANPADDALSITINGLPWEATELNLQRLDPDLCASWAGSQGIPQLDPFTHQVRFEIAPETMEPVQDGCENLVVRGYATAGEMSPDLGVFNEDQCLDDDPALEKTLEWVGSDIERPNPDGVLVDFDFVLRDGRGGLVNARRTACVYTEDAP